MSSEIANFISRFFYEGRLLPFRDTPGQVVWIDVKGRQEHPRDNPTSSYNIQELNAITQQCKKLGQNADIKLISFYQAQIDAWKRGRYSRLPDGVVKKAGCNNRSIMSSYLDLSGLAIGMRENLRCSQIS